MEDRPLPEKHKLVPENATKVFDGVIYDVYQWDQQMFDGSTQKFEMLKRPDTVVIIPTIGDKIILLNEEQPGGIKRQSFCMGRVEENESAVKAALRELEEETGIVPNELYYLNSEQVNDKIEWFIHFFITQGVNKSHRVKHDVGEKINFREISVEELILMATEQQISVPKVLLKFLLRHQVNDFKDRIEHPNKYFDRVEV